MPDLLPCLRALVASDRFLAAINLDKIDDMLDARDATPFDSEWARVNGLVMQHQPSASDEIDTLRESAFKRAFAITEFPDACGYISDDFGLIANAARAPITDPWLSALVASYVSGEFPHGELDGDPRELYKIVGDFQS